jgi:hypothetical protein
MQRVPEPCLCSSTALSSHKPYKNALKSERHFTARSYMTPLGSQQNFFGTAESASRRLRTSRSMLQLMVRVVVGGRGACDARAEERRCDLLYKVAAVAFSAMREGSALRGTTAYPLARAHDRQTCGRRTSDQAREAPRECFGLFRAGRLRHGMGAV